MFFGTMLNLTGRGAVWLARPQGQIGGSSPHTIILDNLQKELIEGGFLLTTHRRKHFLITILPKNIGISPVFRYNIQLNGAWRSLASAHDWGS